MDETYEYLIRYGTQPLNLKLFKGFDPFSIRSYMKFTLILFFTVLAFIVTANALSAPIAPAGDRSVAASDSTRALEVSPDTWRSFEALLDVINQSKNDLSELRTRLDKAKDESEREKILSNIELVQSNIQSLQQAWEMWATGGVDM